MTPSSSYEERHDRAGETFSIFAPDVEPERVASSMARRLGALGSFAFDVVGEMWARPELSRRDRSLIVVSTLAAQARDEELELHTGVALRNGLTRTEIEELVVTVAAYAGFPAAMAASRRVDTALRAAADVEQLEGRQAAAAKSDAERDRDAAEVLAGMTVGVGLAIRRPSSRPSPRLWVASGYSHTGGRSARSGRGPSSPGGTDRWR